MTNSTDTTRFRFWLWLIRFVGVIVPRRLRADWRQEWEAELRHREALLAEWDKLNWQSKLSLLWRSTSAFWDAIWLQPKRLEDEMFQDLRYGIRMLLNAPGFTLMAILTLSLGIGANTAIFSVVNATLLRPLPYQNPDQLVMVWGTNPGGFGWRGKTGFSAPSFIDYQAQNQSFERMETFNSTDFTLVGNDKSDRIRAGIASDGFFEVLKVQPILGRNIAQEDCQTGKDHVVVLSYGLWQQRFGSDANIVGNTIRLDTSPYLVIGVLPKDFDFSIPEYFESKALWVPGSAAQGDSDRGHKYLSVIAR